MSYKPPTIGGILAQLKLLFFAMGEEEGEQLADQYNMPDDIDSDDQTGGGSSDTIKAGKRANRWYERMDKIVMENRVRTIRLEYRTVWIMRILVAILGAVAAGLTIEYLPL